VSLSPAEQFICLGVIASPIGIRGEVRVKTFTDEPEGLADYGTLITGSEGREVDVLAVRVVKGGLGMFLEGVTDRDAADALKGTELGVYREALGGTEDDETFYHVDLIGLEVRDMGGETIGDVKTVHDFGGGDVLELNLTANVKTELVPFRMETVPEVDIEGGFLVLAETAWLGESPEKEEGEGE
jgi:16S rRNA processing protein RimM